jgi:predicted ester cyclase
MKHTFVLLALITLSATSCSNNQSTTDMKDTSMSSIPPSANNSMLERNKATALASAGGFNNHSVDQIFKDAAPDIVDYGDGSGPAMKGRDSIKVMMKDFFTSFPDMKADNMMAIAEGNKVAVFADWSGTFKGNFMGVKATNKPFKFKDVDLYTFNDAGQITEHRGTQSMDAFWGQVGAKQPK